MLWKRRSAGLAAGKDGRFGGRRPAGGVGDWDWEERRQMSERSE